MRYSEIRRGKGGGDPYVVAYIRNDTYGDPNEGWRNSKVTGLADPILKTDWKGATVNPEWNHEAKDIKIVTGSFEKKTKNKAFSIALTSWQQQRMEDTHALQIARAGGRGQPAPRIPHVNTSGERVDHVLSDQAGTVGSPLKALCVQLWVLAHHQVFGNVDAAVDDDLLQTRVTTHVHLR